jgi:hypothetical protein
MRPLTVGIVINCPPARIGLTCKKKIKIKV